MSRSYSGVKYNFYRKSTNDKVRRENKRAVYHAVNSDPDAVTYSQPPATSGWETW